MRPDPICAFGRWRRAGFTFIEVLISIVLLTLITYASWELVMSGFKQIDTSGDHFTAMQNALLLMERIQGDLRSISILNRENRSLIPYSMAFSPNRKSFTVRRSTLTDPRGSRMGSSFTIVTYQLVENPSMPGTFVIRREERTASGEALPGGTGTSYDERQFRNLLLSDIRYDFIARLESMSIRQFVRVSLTSVNEKPTKGQPRVYYISNLFQVAPPEVPYRPRAGALPAFAKQFFPSGPWKRRIDPNGEIGPAPGNHEPLQVPVDYVDAAGVGRSMPDPKVGPTLQDPFQVVDSLPPLRGTFLRLANSFLTGRLGPDFRGRMFGEIPAPRPPGAPFDWTPEWVEAFALEALPTTTQPVMVQLDELLGRLRPRGAAAVAEMGHWFAAGMSPVTTAVAQRIVDE